jgi:hypothetical protein
MAVGSPFHFAKPAETAQNVSSFVVILEIQRSIRKFLSVSLDLSHIFSLTCRNLVLATVLIMRYNSA